MPSTFNLTEARAKREAAAREARGEQPSVTFGEHTVVLPVELPLDVFTPLADIAPDLVLLVRKTLDVYKARQAGDAAEQFASTDMIVDLLTANLDLPQRVIDGARDVAVRLFEQEGYDAFTAQRPTGADVVALGRFVFEAYGTSLGEASAPAASLTSGGRRSKRTSRASSTSTPEAS